MKTVLLLFLPCFAHAQSIALLDRALKNPVAVTQSLTAKQLGGKVFPIYITDFDAVIRFTENLAHYLDTGAAREPNMQVLAAGHSQFAVTTQRIGAYNIYSIFLSTRSGDLGASLELVTRENGSRKAAMQQMQLFLDYLKNNRHLAAEN